MSTGIEFITHDNAIIKFSNGTDLIGRINVGKNCFIGVNVILLTGVNISNCIVGIGRVITKPSIEE